MFYQTNLTSDSYTVKPDPWKPRQRETVCAFDINVLQRESSESRYQLQGSHHRPSELTRLPRCHDHICQVSYAEASSGDADNKSWVLFSFWRENDAAGKKVGVYITHCCTQHSLGGPSLPWLSLLTRRDKVENDRRRNPELKADVKSVIRPLWAGHMH